MGVIYSTNITPSKTYGIGNYTEAQFENAVRHGIRADGSHLYPAMPYTSYAGLTDQDVHALYYYFTHGVQPVEQPNRITSLGFPFNLRQAMWGWNLLFLKQNRSSRIRHRARPGTAVSTWSITLSTAASVTPHVIL